MNSITLIVEDCSLYLLGDEGRWVSLGNLSSLAPSLQYDDLRGWRLGERPNNMPTIAKAGPQIRRAIAEHETLLAASRPNRIDSPSPWRSSNGHRLEFFISPDMIRATLDENPDTAVLAANTAGTIAGAGEQATALLREFFPLPLGQEVWA